MNRGTRARLAALIVCGLLVGAWAGAWHQHLLNLDPDGTTSSSRTCALCAILHHCAPQPTSLSVLPPPAAVAYEIAPPPLVVFGAVDRAAPAPRGPPVPSVA